MQGDPWTDLTVAVEINYFQLNKAEYYLPVMVKIPGSELVLAKKRGADVASIDFIGEIKDDYGGTTVDNISDHVDFKVSDKTAEELAKQADLLLVRLYLVAGQVHHQGAGAGRCDGEDRDVPDHVPDSEPEQGDQAGADQLRGAVRAAHADDAGDLQRQPRARSRRRKLRRTR